MYYIKTGLTQTNKEGQMNGIIEAMADGVCGLHKLPEEERKNFKKAVYDFSRQYGIIQDFLSALGDNEDENIVKKDITSLLRTQSQKVVQVIRQMRSQILASYQNLGQNAYDLLKETAVKIYNINQSFAPVFAQIQQDGASKLS